VPRAGVIDEAILDASPCRVWSSSDWNLARSDLRLTRGTWALEDLSNGSVEVFVPRGFDRRRAEPTASAQPAGRDTREESLRLLILRALSEGTRGTRQSMVSFYSADHPAWMVAAAVDRLVAEGAVVLAKEARDSGRVDISITELGRRMLAEAKGPE
jgi:hypothetical protein